MTTQTKRKKVYPDGGIIKSNQQYHAKTSRAGRGIQNVDGSVSSHIMASGDSDGKYYAYPTIYPDINGFPQTGDLAPYLRKNTNWVSPNKPVEEAYNRNELYQFKTRKESEEFAEGNWKNKETQDKTTTMRKKVTTGKTPKLIWGQLLGMAANTGMSLLAANKAKKEQRRATLEAQNMAMANQSEADRLALEEFPEEGLGNVNYYQKKGGQLPPRKKVVTAGKEGYKEDLEKQQRAAYRADITFNNKEKFLANTDEDIRDEVERMITNPPKGGASNEAVRTYHELLALDKDKFSTRPVKHVYNSIKGVLKSATNELLGTDLKKGGKLATPTYATKGGKLNPISSDMEMAKGNTHNESTIDNTTGIKLLKGNKAFAEIEDGETVKDGRMVYSDTSTVDGKTTYAEAAAKLAREKAKVEKNLNTGDKITRQTNTRKLALIDQTENALFMKQETEKKGTNKETNASIPKGKNGLDFKDTKFGKDLADVLPFADNLVNAYLTSQTPKVPKPNLQKYNKLKTTHNANPELAAINDAETAASTFIESNTASSATARNEIAGVRLRGAQQKGQVLAQKENIETGLINADTLNKQAVTSGNLAKMDAYGTQNMQRAGDIQQRISANVANAVGDIVDKKNFDAEMAYKKEQLDVARQYSVNGTSERADLINPTEIARIQSDPIYAAEQVKRYANHPKELEELYKRVPHLRPAGTKALATPNF